jgi:serine/threonine-protein kinase
VDFPDRTQTPGITRIGKYDVIEELGRGGMGVVYRGIDKQIGREVAIKTLTEGFSGDPAMLSRFYDEVRILGRLNHPNIVTVYEVGDDDGTPYIVMERVQGEPLDKLIASGEPMSMPDRLRIVEEVCSALGCAHSNKVIHRDVKPANIFRQPDGKAKLLDFGIARAEKRDSVNSLTRTGHIIGTIPYMSPERLRGETVDGRSDIFAAGVVLYQLVAGQQPFRGTDSVLMQKILHEPHLPLAETGADCPAGLELIIDRALAKAPDDRYSTAEEMAADLATVIADLRQGQVLELMSEAQRLIDAEEFDRAKSVLNQSLKIDSRHAGAREMLGQIQRQLSQRKQAERAQQIRQQAENAISSKRFDQSLEVLEAGREFFESNPELLKLREKAQKEKDRQDRINEYLSHAEAARRKGDYKAAIVSAEKALKADKTNPRIVALHSAISKEAEKAQRQAQAKALLSSARGEIGSRHYNEAIELLKQAEQLDPTNPELPLLLGDASAGLEQARRREAIARLDEEVALASSYEQLQQVALSIEKAMVDMPTEAALFQLKVQVERQLKEHENRRLVEETVQACRDLVPREALELVQQARRRLPGDERLLSLEALLADRIRQQSVEERRAEYLFRAREALGKEKYSDAVRILEFAHAEGIATGELLSLLDFARGEEREHRRLEKLRSDLSRAQSLIADADFDEATAFLEEALHENDDPALRMLLDQASAGNEDLRRQIGATLASAANLVQAGKLDEAVQLLQMQPRPVQRSVRVQGALAAIEDQRYQAVFRTIGRAYAVLGTDLRAGEALIRQAAAASADPAFCASVADSFVSRRRDFADRAVAEVVQKCKTLLREKDREGAERMLMTVSRAIPYASSQVRSEWDRVQKKTSATTLISRLRS